MFGCPEQNKQEKKFELKADMEKKKKKKGKQILNTEEILCHKNFSYNIQSISEIFVSFCN